MLYTFSDQPHKLNGGFSRHYCYLASFISTSNLNHTMPNTYHASVFFAEEHLHKLTCRQRIHLPEGVTLNDVYPSVLSIARVIVAINQIGESKKKELPPLSVRGLPPPRLFAG